MASKNLQSKYLVAIIGRPNVGKSTLFNKILGKPTAIATSIPGTTRDILYGHTIWNKLDFTIADTAGLELDNKAPLIQDVLLQTKAAIESADLIVFLTDIRVCLHIEVKKAADIIEAKKSVDIICF